MAYADTMGRRRRRQSSKLHRIIAILLGFGIAGIAGAPVAYMLWPRSQAIAPDAPSVPISVGGMAFNVPPAAIRFRVQRRPGAQARIDLAFMWPSLSPPDSRIKPLPTDNPDITDRLFVTIAASDRTLSPVERLMAIYPRYTAGASTVGPDGLSRQSFRQDSAYLGEELIHDPAAPERFLLRCSRQVGSTPAMCMHERRIGGADITIRFPREWLTDWGAVADGFDRLIASFKTTGFKPTPQ